MIVFYSIDSNLFCYLSVHFSLICTLSFNLGSDEERHTCRKYFPYQISKPIDVKSKFYYTECDEIYLEAMFQNLTLLPIQLRTIVFDSANFDVASLNFNLDVKDQWIFGATNRLNPNESRQYLFVLTPKKEIRSNASLLKSINVIGKLDIIWYSGIGEKGHIQTSQLEKSVNFFCLFSISIHLKTNKFNKILLN